MRAVPGTLQEGGAAFQTTHWSVVRLAAQSDAPEAAQALEKFCTAYWPPLYAFLRRRGHSSSDAQDLTQAFLASFLEQASLARARRDKGKLRSFLLGSLQHFLADQHDRDQALKRGGGRQIVSLEDHLAEAEAAAGVAGPSDEMRWYDQTWAATLVKRAWEALQAEFAAAGRTAWLEGMKPLVIGGETVVPNQEEVAIRLGVPVATLRTSLRRLRGQYRAALRAEVARTVADPGDIEEELRYLYETLAA